MCTLITLNDITALSMFSNENNRDMVEVVGSDILFPYQSFKTKVSFCVHGVGIMPLNINHSCNEIMILETKAMSDIRQSA